MAIVIGRSRLLEHALVYAALTRRVDHLVFLGDLQAFKQGDVDRSLGAEALSGLTV
ncbi:MAG: hypothetical protein JF607_01220 [Burkholderiales bacterium]|nr:hypothetical protein [Burkholderiales bacterium]